MNLLEYIPIRKKTYRDMTTLQNTHSLYEGNKNKFLIAKYNFIRRLFGGDAFNKSVVKIVIKIRKMKIFFITV